MNKQAKVLTLKRIDAQALKLANQRHVWTPFERRAYALLVKLLKA